MEPMSPRMDLPLLLAITVFFWLVAQAWTLLVFWAEEGATRPSAPVAPRPGPIRKEKKP